ncbi:DUF4013 domain-containing protein [Candidatus Woesearchaeota archaeon]|nr:DUF4013 domain-containing protein [Candidatus Woesearchaeota archaeon]
MEEAIKFKSAFKYPFNRAMGMLNILWLLVPIIGWFALGGYGIRIVQHWIKGDFKELPVFQFGDHLKLGFFMFLKAIPFMIVYGGLQAMLGLMKFSGTMVSILIGIFIVPMLAMNFFNKETVGAFFEFSKIGPVFQNIGDYIIIMLKSIALQIIFIIMIIVLVGIPAGAFTKNIFVADFYRRNCMAEKKE